MPPLAHETPDLRVLFAEQDITTGITSVSQHVKRYGGLADIYDGILKRGQQFSKVAIKVIRANDGDSATATIIRRHRREIAVWHGMAHPNILPLLGLYWGAHPLPAMVSPWCDYGDMNSYVKSLPPGSDRLQAENRVLVEVVRGLAYLHGHEPVIVHGDLKGANILISGDGVVKLCDFGLSRMIAEITATLTVVRGTLRWMAPELLEIDVVPTTASDIWAFACVIVELFSGTIPYSTKKSDQKVLLALVAGELPDRPSNISDDLWELALRCFAVEPTDRPTVQHLQILECTSLNSDLLPSLQQAFRRIPLTVWATILEHTRNFSHDPFLDRLPRSYAEWQRFYPVRPRSTPEYAASQGTILALALTCRTLFETVTPLLYAYVRLHRGSQIARLRHAFESNPKRGSWVTVLEIAPMRLDDSEDLFRDISSILHACATLTSFIDREGVNLSGLRIDHTVTHSTYVLASSTLRRIRLTLGGCKSHCCAGLMLIHTHSRTLTTLELDLTRIELPRERGDTMHVTLFPHFPELMTLELVLSPSHQFTDLLLDSLARSAMPKLQILRLLGSVAPTRTLTRFLRVHGSGILVLDLDHIDNVGERVIPELCKVDEEITPCLQILICAMFPADPLPHRLIPRHATVKQVWFKCNDGAESDRRHGAAALSLASPGSERTICPGDFPQLRKIINQPYLLLGSTWRVLGKPDYHNDSSRSFHDRSIPSILIVSGTRQKRLSQQ